MKFARTLAVAAALTVVGAACDGGSGLGSADTSSFVEAGRTYDLEGFGWHSRVRVVETGNRGWVKAVLSDELAAEAEIASFGDTVWINLDEALLVRERGE